MPKIAWKPVSPNRNVASTRIRCLIPLEALRKKGLSIGLYQDASEEGYDVVVFSKTHDSKSLEQAKRLKKKGTRIIFDLCDNYFYNPYLLSDVEQAKKNIIQMMILADLNVASSEYLALQMAKYVPHQQIHVIEDAVDELLPVTANPIGQWLQYREYKQLTRKIAQWRIKGKSCLVWFGIAGGGKAEYGIGDLKKIQTILHKPAFRDRISLTVISNDKDKFLTLTENWTIPTAYIPWHTATFENVLRLHDISVIPISQNPFTLAKTNNRLALSLYHGLPVIADSIPSYEPFKDICILDDWEKGMESYLNNSNRCFDDVHAGRDLLLKKWSADKISQQWEDLFVQVVNQ